MCVDLISCVGFFPLTCNSCAIVTCQLKAAYSVFIIVGNIVTAGFFT